MNILINIVMGKTNNCCMAQLSHIVAQRGRVGPCPMTMTQFSHSVLTLPYLTVTTLPISAVFC